MASSCHDNGIFSQEPVRACAWAQHLVLSCHCYSALCFLEEHKCCTEWGSKEKRVWMACSPTFWEWGKGRIFQWLCNPLGSWVTQGSSGWVQQTPEAVQASSVQAVQNNALQSDRGLFSFSRDSNQMEGSWGPKGFSLMREQELAATFITILRATLLRKSCEWELGLTGLMPGVTSTLTGSSSPRLS